MTNENETTRPGGRGRGSSQGGEDQVEGQDQAGEQEAAAAPTQPKVGYAPTAATSGVRKVGAPDVGAVREAAKQVQGTAATQRNPHFTAEPQTMVSRDFVPINPAPDEPPELPEGFELPPPPSMVGNAGGLVPPSGVPPLKAFYAGSSSYLIMPRDFMASTEGMRVTSYMLDRTAVDADSMGDRIVQAGTVLAISTGTLLKPRVDAETAVGICRRTVNLRDANQEIGLVIAGAVNINKLWDNEVFGSVASTVIDDLPFIQFRNEDV